MSTIRAPGPIGANRQSAAAESSCERLPGPLRLVLFNDENVNRTLGADIPAGKHARDADDDGAE